MITDTKPTPNQAESGNLVKPMLAEGFIVSKAYEIDFSKIEEGFLYSERICYAKNRNEAKSILLRENKDENICIKGTDDELNYLNIPVIRCKNADKVIFDGKEVVRSSIDELIIERERIAKLHEIANNPNIKYCYIIKGSYYRPNSCGYTSLRFEAGVYPKDEAVSHAKSVREIRLEWVDIEEHNKMINQKIAELQGRLL
jgi:hypothetical protein